MNQASRIEVKSFLTIKLSPTSKRILNANKLLPRRRIERSHNLCASIQAVAMSESTIKVYEASSLSQQQVKEVTARPRIDFTSILQTVCLELEMCSTTTAAT